MNQDIMYRVKEAKSYQMKAILALLPESSAKHIDVIGNELSAMFMEITAEMIMNAAGKYKEEFRGGNYSENNCDVNSNEKSSDSSDGISGGNSDKKSCNRSYGSMNENAEKNTKNSNTKNSNTKDSNTKDSNTKDYNTENRQRKGRKVTIE